MVLGTFLVAVRLFARVNCAPRFIVLRYNLMTVVVLHLIVQIYHST